MTQKDEVTRLKEEGNAFFAKKDYLEASIKYTEAIAVDGSNAVLYSNRAACRLAMKQLGRQ
jgi:stress-induced-phosphoprotein 1